MNARDGRTDSDWKDGFLFLGNQLALDFLNTCPVQNGEPMELLPDFDSILRWFRAAGLLSSREAVALQQHWGESARARRAAIAIRKLRESLRKEILRWERDGSVRQSILDELNRLMARHPMLTSVSTSEKHLRTRQYFSLQEPEDLFAPLAHAAVVLLATADRKRVRMCHHCVLHFQDVSRKGTRRWCSMQLCGNRSKVAAYAARRQARSRDNQR